jgi:hypothetical protein
MNSAALYRDETIQYGETEIQWDRVTIAYGKGNTDEVTFYTCDGEPRVGRIRQSFSVLQGAVSSTPTYSNMGVIRDRRCNPHSSSPWH